VSRGDTHDEYTRRILLAIEEGRPISQRTLARELGVALGLANLLVRRLVSKGYIKIAGIQRNRVRYLMTPAGVVEKARISREYIANTVRLYTETRDRIGSSLGRLSAEWPHDGEAAGKPVVFFGAGEVAEIGFVSMQRTDLRLVGVVDDYVRHPFFGLPVRSPSDLTVGALDGERFGRIVVMSFRKAEQLQGRLDELGVPRERTFLL
jgi:DNA-binding MarR family transcriptional regulator